MKKPLTVALILVFSLGLSTWGATVTLKDGSELQGEIISKGKTSVKIRIEGGLELEIEGDKIAAVDGEKYVVDIRAAYEDLLRNMDDLKAEDHYQAARWCRDKGLGAESKMHLKKAIEIDPKHEGANLALDRVYVEKEGAWMDRAEARNKGYVVSKGSGKWVTEQEAMADRGLKEYKGYMLSDAEIAAMKAREIKRYRSLLYTHDVCDLRGEILRIDFLNKSKLNEKQMQELYAVLLAGENKRQFFQEQRNAINERIEVAFNRLKEEGMKGIYSTYDRPAGVEDAAGSASREIKEIESGFVAQMTPLLEQALKVLGESGPRSQKGSALFAVDHEYCMCCHDAGQMNSNGECAGCHRGAGGRKFESNPVALKAIKDVRAMTGKDWVEKKDKIVAGWCKPIAEAEKLNKAELKRRQMEEQKSIEKIFVEARDYSATDFERNKEMLAAKLATKDASDRLRLEKEVLGQRRHKLTHNSKSDEMFAYCFFDGTLFDYLSGKLGKKATALLAAAGKGTGLVERQNVGSGKADFEQYCTFCHSPDRIMVRIRMGAMGPAGWAEHVPERLRYWKGAWTPEEMRARADAITQYLVELESRYAKRGEKKDEF